MADDMIAKVIVDVVPTGSEEKAKDAATACPVEAISLED